MDRRERERILQRLQADARRIAARFDLKYKAIQAEHPRVRARYGVCYDDGLIKIRLNHVKTGEPLRYSSLIDTLCHELAHLRHFNHGPEFKAFFWQILGWARKQGIYRPQARRRREGLDGPVALPPPGRRPKHRNGVAVFGATRQAELLPWRRLAPSESPPPRPLMTEGLGKHTAQLALAIAGPSAAPKKPTRRSHPRAAVELPAPQLRLFD